MPAVLETRGLTKSYGHVLALSGVDMRVDGGEIVALVGDNGAGKSTFVKTIAGVHLPDGGEILINGTLVRLRSPLEARVLGVETVYQDLALAADLSVWGNLFLGREVRVKGMLRHVGWMDQRAMRARSESELGRLKIAVPSIDAAVEDLSGGQRQAVAVARSIAWGSQLVMMDEPTAALGVAQGEMVADLVKTLAADGVAVILITHNLSQVFQMAHRVVVLRHGREVANRLISSTTREEVVGWITGALEGEPSGRSSSSGVVASGTLDNDFPPGSERLTR